jgi:hypothetical protein
MKFGSPGGVAAGTGIGKPNGANCACSTCGETSSVIATSRGRALALRVKPLNQRADLLFASTGDARRDDLFQLIARHQGLPTELDRGGEKLIVDLLVALRDAHARRVKGRAELHQRSLQHTVSIHRLWPSRIDPPTFVGVLSQVSQRIAAVSKYASCRSSQAIVQSLPVVLNGAVRRGVSACKGKRGDACAPKRRSIRPTDRAQAVTGDCGDGSHDLDCRLSSRLWRLLARPRAQRGGEEGQAGLRLVGVGGIAKGALRCRSELGLSAWRRALEDLRKA